MTRFSAVALTFLLACPVWADPPKIAIPAEVAPSGQYVHFVPATDAVSITYVGLSGVEPIPAELLKDPRLFLLDTRGLAPGRYQFVAVGASATGEQARVSFVVPIGNVPPTPPGPTPPVPTPPGPTPAPPIPLAGLRVLFVFESEDLSRYPVGQLAALYSGEIRSYLAAKCAKAVDGTPERRFWDQNIDTTGAAPHWQAVMQRPRTTLPWLIISTGTTGYEGPLPATEAETLELLKKYGG